MATRNPFQINDPNKDKAVSGAGLDTAVDETQMNPYQEGLGATESAPNSQSTYDYLRSASAKELVDSNIQLAIARQNANKAVSSQVAAMGLGGSGYAGTMAAGIQSAFMRGLGANQENFANSIRDINLQEQNANQESANNSALMVFDAVNSANSMQEINDALALGNLKLDANGNIDFTGSNLSEEQQRQLNYYYNAAKRNAANNSLAQLQGKVSQQVSNELQYLINHASDFQNEGAVVMLTSGYDNNIHHLVKFVNGEWVQASWEDYNKAKSEGKDREIMGANGNGVDVYYTK